MEVKKCTYPEQTELISFLWEGTSNFNYLLRAVAQEIQKVVLDIKCKHHC